MTRRDNITRWLAKGLWAESVSAAKRLAEVNEPSDAALPTDVIIPVRLALVVTLPAVRLDAVPVMLVPTNVDGVPRLGVVKTGLVVYATFQSARSPRL